MVATNSIFFLIHTFLNLTIQRSFVGELSVEGSLDDFGQRAKASKAGTGY